MQITTTKRMLKKRPILKAIAVGENPSIYALGRGTIHDPDIVNRNYNYGAVRYFEDQHKQLAMMDAPWKGAKDECSKGNDIGQSFSLLMNHKPDAKFAMQDGVRPL